MAKKENAIQILRNMYACPEAIEWLGKQKSYKAAWLKCERPDWMLWLVGSLSGEPESARRRKVVRVACECARTALPIYESKYPDDTRPRHAIETAEKWAKKKPGITLTDVRNAAYAAYAATNAAYAAYAAYAAAYAANAKKKSQVQCAEIVRKFYPNPPSLRGRNARQE